MHSSLNVEKTGASITSAARQSLRALPGLSKRWRVGKAQRLTGQRMSKTQHPGVKQQADEQVLQNTQLLNNESYFEKMMQPLVINEFQNRQKIKLTADASRTINHLVVAEYMNEFAAGSRTGSAGPHTGAHAW